MHFFSPANVMKLLEVVRGEKTAQGRARHRRWRSAKKIKKTGVVSGVCDGFIGNRMIEQYSRQAGFLLEEGATPAAGRQGDREVRHRDGAVPHGRPGRQRHRLGRSASAATSRSPSMPLLPRPPTCSASSAASARRPARGWYDYEPGKRDAIPIRGRRRACIDEAPQGARHHAAQDQRRGDRRTACVYALVNEGAKILEEGIAQRASDIDMVYLTGYGFPLHRGGPMLYADTVGLSNVVAGDEALRRRIRTTTPSSGSRRRCSRSSPPKASVQLSVQLNACPGASRP